MMFTADFWRDAIERACKTAAQAAVGVMGTGALGVLDVDWTGVAAAAALGFVLSLLTSLASEPFGDPGTPSLVTPNDDTSWDDDPPTAADDMTPVGE